MNGATHERAALTALAAANAAARSDGRPRWVALRRRVVRQDCLALFAAAADDERFYWERPAAGRSLVGLGCAHAIEAHGADRFRTADAAARALLEDLTLVGDAGPPCAGPLLVGGFAFSEATGADYAWQQYPAARLVLPAVAFVREGDRMWCTRIRCVPPDADPEREAAAWSDWLRGADDATVPGSCGGLIAGEELSADLADPRVLLRADRPHADYREGIEAALRDISAGEIEKVVLARSVSIQRNEAIEPAELLRELRDAYPTCTTFGVGRPGAVFVGASPEQLVRVEGTTLTTAAVAGSAPRGRNPSDDARLARELLESKKEQAEHAIVVRALRAALRDCCDPLDVPEAPRLMRLGEIQHLETPIHGTLRNGESILGLIGRMHPTPAVGGAPRAAAAAWISRHEALDRGWYAGPVGFVDADGGGDFCVALRSALVHGHEARLYAGAGVVAGSQPEAELRETRLKLRALLAPLLEI